MTGIEEARMRSVLRGIVSPTSRESETLSLLNVRYTRAIRIANAELMKARIRGSDTPPTE